MIPNDFTATPGDSETTPERLKRHQLFHHLHHQLQFLFLAKILILTGLSGVCD